VHFYRQYLFIDKEKKKTQGEMRARKEKRKKINEWALARHETTKNQS
jgi:hypothetical protein